MARPPVDQLERLRNEVSVQRLVEAAGIELKKAGEDLLGHCPFHEDQTASLVLRPLKNHWHCLGCGIDGGPIEWVVKLKGLSFRHAVELLKEDPSLALGLAAYSRKPSSVRALAVPVATDADDQTLLDQCLDYYHQTLKNSPEALAYLNARALAHPELIERFRLGYANRTLGLRLPLKSRTAGALLRSKLQRIGILRESGHEHFNGSLVIPVQDAQGHALQVYGRKLRDDLRAGTPQHLYLPGPHAGVFNLAGVIEAGARRDDAAGARELILCEGLIDALTFWVHGFTNVTAVYGSDGCGDDMFSAIQTFGIERVLIAFGRNAAGERGAEALAKRLMARSIEALRVQFPRGMDANGYARKQQLPAQALGMVLRQARWIGRCALAKTSQGVNETGTAATAKPIPLCETADITVTTSGRPHASFEVPATADEGSGAPADEFHLQLGVCQWRVRGWRRNPSPEQMRVNLQVRRVDGPGAGAYHVDTLDLYQAKSRALFLRQACTELRLADDDLKRELGHVLLKLEMLQDEALRLKQAPKTRAPILTADEEFQALSLLRSPNLAERIVADLQQCGVVGESMNLLAGYLAATSRKLSAPLAVLIQSSSAAGKTSLMEAVLTMMPPEERIQFSAMTGQSLFYLGETDLQHKILSVAEEEGVRQAAYALKLLQSEGKLTIASTGKDERTGNLVTKEYRVQGPVMLMLTTSASDVDEELLNRCVMLTINESREQTRAIHARQRHQQTLEGLLAETDRTRLIALHQNAQRLLQPVAVVNPYAQALSFGDHQTRARRDHAKYLSLIAAIALLHQHQRPLKTVHHCGQTVQYIEATREDIALANQVAHEVLGRTLDELPPQSRKLLTLLRDWVRELCKAHGVKQKDLRFTRRELREAIRWGDTQLKVHLARLVEMEFIAVHRRGAAHAYELVYDGDDDGKGLRAHLCGLTDIDSVESQQYDGDRSGHNRARSVSGRRSVGTRSDPRQGKSDPCEPFMPCDLQPDGEGYIKHKATKKLHSRERAS